MSGNESVWQNFYGKSTTIQGVDGASTYCAPIGAACNGGGLNMLTEQNFQSFAQRNICRNYSRHGTANRRYLRILIEEGVVR